MKVETVRIPRSRWERFWDNVHFYRHPDDGLRKYTFDELSAYLDAVTAGRTIEAEYFVEVGKAVVIDLQFSKVASGFGSAEVADIVLQDGGKSVVARAYSSVRIGDAAAGLYEVDNWPHLKFAQVGDETSFLARKQSERLVLRNITNRSLEKRRGLHKI